MGVCKKEKLKKPIFIGHSLGGMCGVYAASLMEKKLYGLVIVDTAIMPPTDNPPKFDLKVRANNVYKKMSDIIVTNRKYKELRDVYEKCFSRDIFNEN